MPSIMFIHAFQKNDVDNYILPSTERPVEKPQYNILRDLIDLPILLLIKEDYDVLFFLIFYWNCFNRPTNFTAKKRGEMRSIFIICKYFPTFFLSFEGRILGFLTDFL